MARCLPSKVNQSSRIDDNQGAHAATVAPGKEIVLGSLRVILVSRTPDNREAVVMESNSYALFATVSFG